jgi:hypothetical protein
LLTVPSLILSFVVASLIGLGFYLLFGRGWLRLAAYWLVALAGFALGQAVTTLVRFGLMPIGQVNVLEAGLTALIALFVTRALWKQN